MTRVLVLLVCLALAATVGLSALSLASRGHPVALPLDDAYIYLQYARAAAHGAVGRYFPGGPLSTGATSPLWAALLTVDAVVLRGSASDANALPAAAIFLEIGFAGLALFLAWRLARRHGAGPVSAWAAPGAALAAPLWLFGMFNGMETALMSAAVLAGGWALAGGSRWWLVMLALARPEGALLALGILAFRFLAGKGPGRGPRPWMLPAAVVLAALVTLALPWVLTGSPAAAWAAKALLREPKPEVREFYFPRVPYFSLRALWFGLSGARAQPALGVLGEVLRPEAWASWVWTLYLGVGALLAVAFRRGRGPLTLWILISLSALGAVAWDAQLYRYLVAGYPLLAVAAAAGWFGRRRASGPVLAGGGGEPRRIEAEPVPVLLRRAAGGLVLAAALAGAFFAGRGLGVEFRWLYRGQCERLAGAQWRTGAWIRANLPGDARVAAHDVGAIAFVGARPVTDLVGLVTPAMAGAYRDGEGALWEALEDLPPGRRPGYAAVVPAWMPYLARTRWFGTRLWQAEPTSGPVGRAFEVRRLSWPGTDTEVWPGGDFDDRPGLHGAAAGEPDREVVDGVDVADGASERRHGYRSEGRSPATVVRDLGFASDRYPARGAHAMEGGRDVYGTVRFRLAARAGKPAYLVLRSASPRAAVLSVRAGAWSDTLRVPQDEVRFSEPGVAIPAGVTASAGGAIEFTVEGAGYRAFHWWLLQPR